MKMFNVSILCIKVSDCFPKKAVVLAAFPAYALCMHQQNPYTKKITNFKGNNSNNKVKR